MRQPRRSALSCAIIMIVALLGPVAVSSPAQALTDGEKTKVLKVAKSLKGTPYRYGGASPKSGFDCSGFTQYVFKKAKAGNLKRTAGAQKGQGKAVKKHLKRKGDLVIFQNGGKAYHVGIYHSKGRIWHSPRTGSSVKLEKIWSSNYVVRRVR
jgi:cell wall-associated NlpC family hydrolase